MGDCRVIEGDCIASMAALPSGLSRCCVTSPPYFGLRDYGHEGQIGLEPTPAEYVAKMVAVFREVRRVLADDGTLWLNLGDSYATDSKWGGSTGGKHVKALHGSGGGGREKTASGLPDKNLLGIPWRVAFALQDDGWYLRSDIIWHKPNTMPESVTDRPTKAHEYLFLLSKSRRYFYDAAAVAEEGSSNVPWGANSNGGAKQAELGNNAGRRLGRAAVDSSPSGTRNRRTVWTITTKPFRGAHFAVMPEALVEPCIIAGSEPGDTVIDPFGGSGTVGVVAAKRGRSAVLCELNPIYAAMARERIAAVQPSLGLEAA